MTLPELDRTRIHVWTGSLALDAARIDECCAILAGDERARADRVQVSQARRRFIVARVLLRRLLSRYLQTDPASIAIAYGPHGKPRVANESGIHFNLSHAEDSVVVAIALQREVGIDIEAVSRNVDVDGVAEQAFSPVELHALASLSAPARRDAFYRTWVRKEAYLKARGDGFSRSTRSFSVSPLPLADDALLGDDARPEAPLAWRVAELPAPVGFRAALAAQGRDWSVLTVNVAD